MATTIRRAPVLTGKIARDFYKTLEHATAKESKPEIEAIITKWQRYLSTQKVFKE